MGTVVDALVKQTVMSNDIGKTALKWSW